MDHLSELLLAGFTSFIALTIFIWIPMKLVSFIFRKSRQATIRKPRQATIKVPTINPQQKKKAMIGFAVFATALVFYTFFLRNPLIGEWQRENCRYSSTCSELTFARNAMTTRGRHFPVKYDVGTEYVTVTSDGQNKTYKLSGFWNTKLDDDGTVYIRK